jgi:hypothetical protein
VADVDRFERVSPHLGAVGGSVVGHDRLDGDPTIGEPFAGSHHEPQCGDSGFVVTELGVGDSTVVVDGFVEEGPSDPGLFGDVASAVETPAATRRDLPELLDIDMHQLPRDALLVAADHPT